MGSPSRSTTDNTMARESSTKRHTAKPCRDYAQGTCPHGDSCNYPHVLHTAVECSPTSSPRLAFPPSYLASDIYDVKTPVYYETAAHDAGNTPYATPATPASCITEVGSPVLSPQAPPGLGPVKVAPAKAEERGPKRRRQGSRSSTENGGCFYRTKPCRFFHSGSGFCVKGDRCNFIHDQALNTRATVYDEQGDTASTLAGSLAASPKSDYSPSPRHMTPTRADAKASPRESVSPVESSPRSNYYPITWRVIGGGVQMGGRREVCRAYRSGNCPDGVDCRFSHGDEPDEPIAIAPPTDIYYPHYDQCQWSPPTYFINPWMTMPQLVSPSLTPSTDTSLSVSAADSKPAAKSLTINAYAARPVITMVQPRIMLDGSTLLPVSQDTTASENGSPLPSRSSSPTPASDRLDARNIVRPVSTPPYSSAAFTTPKVANLFQAESP